MPTIDLARRYKLPKYINDAARKGLKYHEAGFSGDGIMPATVRAARDAARGEGWTEDKIIRAAAWFARHESSLVAGSFDEEKPRPSGVAWLLWGSDPSDGDKGRSWIEARAAEFQGDELSKHNDASTPAPKSDQIKGSDKNKAGSAATKGSEIKVNDATRAALRKKVRDHNDANPQKSKRATLNDLLKVYRRGAGAFSTSHRPNVTSRAQWAMARVNAYLYLLKNGKPKKAAYVTDNDLLPDGHPKKAKEKSMHRKGHKKKKAAMYGAGAKKKKDGYYYSAEGERLAYASERIAIQRADMPESGVMRHTVAPGVDLILDADDTVYQVIADAEMHSKEAFDEWLQANGYKAQSEDGDGVEREDAGKTYRLDDGSDLQYSKPVTTGQDLQFFHLTDDADSRDLHVLKAGPLHDLDSGELILDLSVDRLKEIADTSQAILNTGHAIPVSFEHGIEAGHRGEKADRRPYGEITEIYYDEQREAIYAKKRWTDIGRQMVEASMVDSTHSALRVSPRIRLTPAHHPDTGELLGNSGYIDVVSLTTLPRQARMENVALSRVEAKLKDLETGRDGAACCDDGKPQGQKGCIMAGQTTADAEQVNETLLSRGSTEAARIIDACGLKEDATAEELSRRVADIKEELDRAQVELGRYVEAEATRVRAEREAEADKLLDTCEFKGAERDFYRASLLGDNESAREFARKAIEEKGAPDQLEKVTEAIESAKERGALTADFGLNDELTELARVNADTVVALFSAMPAGQVVRVGDAAGSDAAGLDNPVDTIDAQKAERELSRFARKLKQEGKAKTMVEAWNLARTERSDLVAAMNGDK